MKHCDPLINQSLILAFDFDGLITTNPGISNEPLQLQEGCKDLLLALYSDGNKHLILNTCRTGPVLEAAICFLNQEGLLQVFSEVNENCKAVREKYYPHNSRKVGADVYFDDKNLGASYLKGFTPEGRTIIDWEEIGRLIYGLYKQRDSHRD